LPSQPLDSDELEMSDKVKLMIDKLGAIRVADLLQKIMALHNLHPWIVFLTYLGQSCSEVRFSKLAGIVRRFAHTRSNLRPRRLAAVAMWCSSSLPGSLDVLCLRGRDVSTGRVESSCNFQLAKHTVFRFEANLAIIVVVLWPKHRQGALLFAACIAVMCPCLVWAILRLTMSMSLLTWFCIVLYPVALVIPSIVGAVFNGEPCSGVWVYGLGPYVTQTIYPWLFVFSDYVNACLKDYLWLSICANIAIPLLLKALSLMLVKPVRRDLTSRHSATAVHIDLPSQPLDSDELEMSDKVKHANLVCPSPALLTSALTRMPKWSWSLSSLLQIVLSIVTSL